MNYDSQKKIITYQNPIDYIEDLVYKYDLDSFRDSENDLSLKYKGLWNSYDIIVSWDDNNKIINLVSYYDISKKNKIGRKIYSLISCVNEKINLGYFSFSSKLNTVFFKYHISVKGHYYLSKEQIENCLDVVTKECDRFFPAFYLFFCKKQDPNFALKQSLIDTHGEA